MPMSIEYVYVAGPYASGEEVAENVRSAIIAADQLIAKNFMPFVPHLSHLHQMITPYMRGFWLKWSAAWMLRCDAVLSIEPEVKSEGRDAELVLADEWSIPVFTTVAALVAAAAEENKND